MSGLASLTQCYAGCTRGRAGNLPPLVRPSNKRPKHRARYQPGIAHKHINNIEEWCAAERYLPTGAVRWTPRSSVTVILEKSPEVIGSYTLLRVLLYGNLRRDTQVGWHLSDAEGAACRDQTRLRQPKEGVIHRETDLFMRLSWKERIGKKQT